MTSKKQYAMFGIVALLAVFTVLSVAMIQHDYVTPASSSDAAINYHSNVCKSVLRVDGTYEDLGCNSNVLYSTGAEGIEQAAGAGTGEAFIEIVLCNATAGCGTPVAAASEAFTEYTNCGLAAASGTYASLGTGNWSVSKTFTSTCDNVMTNSTRLRAVDNNPNFAGNSFTLVTLQNNDQLTINWTIWVS